MKFKNIKRPKLTRLDPKRWDNFFLKCIGGADPKPIVKGNMFMAKSKYEKLKNKSLEGL